MQKIRLVAGQQNGIAREIQIQDDLFLSAQSSGLKNNRYYPRLELQ